MPSTALTDEEKERIRYHLGYLETSLAPSIQFGIPRPLQTLFLVEDAIQLLINPFAIERVRRVLFELDQIEQQISCVRVQLMAEQLGDIKLRSAEPGRTVTDLLEGEYTRWAKRLADILGVPLYWYSSRFKGRGGAGSIPVVG